MSERWCAIDTNILLRAADAGSSVVDVARNAVVKLRSDGAIPVIFPQMLVEFWVVATRPTFNNGLGWDATRATKELDQLLQTFTVFPEQGEIFVRWRSLVTRLNITGKRAHDARIVAAMLSHGVPELLTFNSDDFRAFNGISVLSPEKLLVL